MSHITEQAQRAIDAMLKAGFARSEFRVRTERVQEGGTFINRNGRTVRSYHYGDAIIHPNVSNARIAELTPALVAAGLAVHEWADGGYRSVHTCRYHEKPAFHPYAEKAAEWAEAAAWLAAHPEVED